MVRGPDRQEIVEQMLLYVGPCVNVADQVYEPGACEEGPGADTGYPGMAERSAPAVVAARDSVEVTIPSTVYVTDEDSLPARVYEASDDRHAERVRRCPTSDRPSDFRAVTAPVRDGGISGSPAALWAEDVWPLFHGVSLKKKRPESLRTP